MKNDALVRIYTRPLFDLAVESDTIEAIGGELDVLRQLFEQVPVMAEYLDSPNVKRKEKIDLLKKAYEKSWSAYFSSYLQLVLRKGRQGILPHSQKAFTRYWDEYRSKLDVIVTSAVNLTDAQKESISKKLAIRTGKNVTLECKTDPAVMGGIKFQIGHQLLDATVSGKLAALKESLLLG
ncbi:ATP synthase F1 subunit delta [bacterium]|nr:ATP synthase F1 subunit delta [bacterium]MBU1650674.1 ATP synthase F1 subunit delta [bacterium]MBU1880776.1 ATP synthase F1 subunit delta [bacterium]